MPASVETVARPATRLPFVNSPLVHLPERELLCSVNFSGTGLDTNLFLVETGTGRALRHRLPNGERGAYGFVAGSDGNLYLGTFTGRVHRFDVSAGRFEEVARPFPARDGERARLVWGGGASRAGRVYMGVYPTGEFCEYDIGTGRTTVVSPMPSAPGLGFYASGFVELPDGSILVFVRGARPSLFAYRPGEAGAEKIEIGGPLPESLFFEGFLDDGRLIVDCGKSEGCLRPFDWRTRRFGPPLVEGQPEKISHLARHRGALYGVGYPSGTVYGISGGRARPAVDGLFLRGGRLTGLFPAGDDLVSQSDNGLFLRFNPERGIILSRQLPNTSRRGMQVHMLEEAPGKRLLVGSHFINMQVFTLDRRTGRVRPSRHKVSGYTGQVTCGAALGRSFYFASYGSAVLYRFRPEKPFRHGRNPEVLGTAGHEQNRPLGLFAHRRRLYMVSRAGYGRLGGAITVYTPATGRMEVYRDFVPFQNPAGGPFFDPGSGRIGGATQVHGDQGSAEPRAEKAVIFAWDTAARETVATFSPWDAPSLPATAVSPAGLLVGVGVDEFYLCDLRSLSIETRSWEHGPLVDALFLDERQMLCASPEELYLLDIFDNRRTLFEKVAGASHLRRFGRELYFLSPDRTAVRRLRLPAEFAAGAVRKRGGRT